MVIKFSFFKIVVCILLLLPAFDAVSKECENRPGAAILPYAIDSNGDIQVLLARDTRGFWSSFGGGAKYVLSVDEPIARCEKSEETAVRETWEESRFLLSRSFLIEALKTATTIPANPLDSDFVTFVIMIEEIELSPYYSTPVVLDSASAETDGVAWFTLSALVDFAQGKREQVATPNEEPLRTVFWESLKPVLLNEPETIFIKK